MITQRAAECLVPADAMPFSAEPFTWQTPKPFTRPHKEELLLWPGTGSSMESQFLSHRAWEPFLAQLSISLLLEQNGYQTGQQGKVVLSLGKMQF